MPALPALLLCAQRVDTSADLTPTPTLTRTRTPNPNPNPNHNPNLNPKPKPKPKPKSKPKPNQVDASADCCKLLVDNWLLVRIEGSQQVAWLGLGVAAGGLVRVRGRSRWPG